MNTILGILGAAALFVLFALASRFGRTVGCGACDESDRPADCGACPMDIETRESSDVT